MKTMPLLLSLLGAIILLSPSPLLARKGDQISIVGSSTIYPFAAIVAERFGRSTPFKTPVIESTGSGGGMKLFCAGIGLAYPDVTNASRRINPNEKKSCNDRGITITEFITGNDGIILSNATNGPKFNISIMHIAAALTAELPGGGDSEMTALHANKLASWADVDAYVARLTNAPLIGLPALPIKVMVPPPSSGTRDALSTLFMKAGAEKLGIAEQIHYEAMREDGAVIEVGENDNLIIEKLVANDQLFGIFGYSFFDLNRDKVQAAILDGTVPDFETIASYEYPGARPLFTYVKREHLNVIPGLREFFKEFISEKAAGFDGYLFSAGLVPLSDDDFAEQRARLNSFPALADEF